MSLDYELEKEMLNEMFVYEKLLGFIDDQLTSLEKEVIIKYYIFNDVKRDMHEEEKEDFNTMIATLDHHSAIFSSIRKEIFSKYMKELEKKMATRTA